MANERDKSTSDENPEDINLDSVEDSRRGLVTDDVKLDQYSNTESAEQQGDEGVTNADKAVGQLLTAFWDRLAKYKVVPRMTLKAAQSTQAQLGSSDRPQAPAVSVGRPSRPTGMQDRSDLDEATQIALQDLAYVLVYDLRLNHKGRSKPLAFGRKRHAAAVAQEAIADAGPSRPVRTAPGGPADAASTQAEQRATGTDEVFSDAELGISQPPQNMRFEDGIALVSRAVQSNAQDPRRIAEIMVRHVGPLAENVYNADVKPETILDGLTQVLLVAARMPALSQAVIQVVPTLRRMLGRGLVDRSDAQGFEMLDTMGEVATLTSLATLASVAVSDISTNRNFEPLLMVYYHEVLRMIVDWQSDDEDLDTVQVKRIVESSTNNIAAGVGRYIQREGISVPDEGVRVEIVSTLVEVSVLLSDNRTNIDEDALVALAQQLGFGKEAQAGIIGDTSDWANRMSGRHMVSVPEEPKPPEILMSLRYAATALIREPIGNGENMASSFFNAGVELLRVKDSDRQVAPLRAVVNALGLLSALKSSDDMHVVMNTNDGGDCMVNLLGSLVGVRAEHRKLLTGEEIGAFTTKVKSVNQPGFIGSEQDGYRVERSIDRLAQMGAVMAAEPPDVDLKDAVQELLNRLLERLGLSVYVSREPMLPEMAEVVKAAFAKFVPDFEDEVRSFLKVFARESAAEGKLKDIADRLRSVAGGDLVPEEAMSTYLVAFIAKMMSQSSDWRDRLQTLYRTKFGGSTFADAGPLVAMQAMTEDKWRGELDFALAAGDELEVEMAFRTAFGPLRGRPEAPPTPGEPTPPPAPPAAPGGLPGSSGAPATGLEEGPDVQDQMREIFERMAQRQNEGTDLQGKLERVLATIPMFAAMQANDPETAVVQQKAVENMLVGFEPMEKMLDEVPDQAAALVGGILGIFEQEPELATVAASNLNAAQQIMSMILNNSTRN